MAVEEPRRIALHRAAAASWGEEVANTLMDSIAPPGHEVATRADIRGVLTAMDAMDARWDERLASMDAKWEERFASMDARLAAQDEKWDARMEAHEERSERRFHETLAMVERRIADAVTNQTRTLVWSQLGAVVVIAGLAFGLR